MNNCIYPPQFKCTIRYEVTHRRVGVWRVGGGENICETLFSEPFIAQSIMWNSQSIQLLKIISVQNLTFHTDSAPNISLPIRNATLSADKSMKP